MRLIGAEGEQIGVVALEEALELANTAGLDVVQMTGDFPPVCRLMDYGKFLFLQKKKHKKQATVQLKEIKFRPNTEEHDYSVKMKRVQKFIEDGDKVKIVVQFRGREIAHKDLGMRLLKRVMADVAEWAKIEQEPKFEGRQMVMTLVPQKSKLKTR